MTAFRLAERIGSRLAARIGAVEVGGIAPVLINPVDAAPAGYAYLVDSNGNYLADSNNDWLIADTADPSPFADELYVKASDLVLSDGAAVSSWVSGEGNAYDFTQATAGKQPTYVASSLIGSKPAVSFDGGDILKCATAISTSNTGSLWFVCRRSADTDFQAVFSQNNQAAAAYIAFYHRYDVARLAVDSIATAATGGATSVDSNDIVIISSDGSVITMNKNGVSQTVTDATTGNWFADFVTAFSSIGGIAYSTDVFLFSGLIAEIGVCSTPLTADQIATLLEYANVEYGI